MVAKVVRIWKLRGIFTMSDLQINQKYFYSLKEIRSQIHLDENFRIGIRFIDKQGGLPLYEITEIFGPAGSGKTIFLHQCLSYFLLEDDNRTAIFMDPDGTFDPKKIIYCLKEESVDIDSILRRVYVWRPTFSSNFAEKIKTQIDFILDRNLSSSILILIDSLPNLLFMDYMDRIKFNEKYLRSKARFIIRLGMTLRYLIDNFKTTVLVSNHIRSYISLSKTSLTKVRSQTTINLPALGDLWDFFVDNRIYLRKTGKQKRVIHIVFSSILKETFSLIDFANGRFY
ncbi:MAG: hypothetical protein ACP6IQ_05845 [Candidatus Njordarchaeia archaeon]